MFLNEAARRDVGADDPYSINIQDKHRTLNTRHKAALNRGYKAASQMVQYRLKCGREKKRIQKPYCKNNCKIMFS